MKKNIDKNSDEDSVLDMLTGRCETWGELRQ